MIRAHNFAAELSTLSAINRGASALEKVSERDMQAFRGNDDLGALCWILRQHEKSTPKKVCKMLEIALDKGVSINGSPYAPITPLVLSMQRGDGDLEIARWLISKGASVQQHRAAALSPIEQLVHVATRASQLDYKDGASKMKGVIDTAKIMIAAGVKMEDACRASDWPLNYLIQNLIYVKRSKLINEFMDLFWEAGHPWLDAWEDDVNISKLSWKALPSHAHHMIAQGEAARIASQTQPVQQVSLHRRRI